MSGCQLRQGFPIAQTSRATLKVNWVMYMWCSSGQEAFDSFQTVALLGEQIKKCDCYTAEAEASRGEKWPQPVLLPKPAFLSWVLLFHHTSFKFLGTSCISAPLHAMPFSEKDRCPAGQVCPGDWVWPAWAAMASLQTKTLTEEARMCLMSFLVMNSRCSVDCF